MASKLSFLNVDSLWIYLYLLLDNQQVTAFSKVSLILIIVLRFLVTSYLSYELTPWLMKPGGSLPNSQGFPIIPILSRVNPVPIIVNNVFKTYFNIFLPSSSRLSSRSTCYNFEQTPIFHSGYISRFNHLEYIR